METYEKLRPRHTRTRRRGATESLVCARLYGRLKQNWSSLDDYLKISFWYPRIPLSAPSRFSDPPTKKKKKNNFQLGYFSIYEGEITMEIFFFFFFFFRKPSELFHRTMKKNKKVKIRFIPPPHPLFFLSAICFSDVFSDYKTFFLWRFSRKCIV